MGDLLTWSADRPAWQRDALRRLVVQQELTATDIDELYQICTGRAEGVPLDNVHVAPVAVTANPVRLLSIADVVGVNALATEQRLEFAPEGLTVVYGDNGSGKSGYVRILKHACRSRDTKFSILPDVNGDQQTPQAAKISFRHGPHDCELQWTPGQGRHDVLPAVSIFDSGSANTHLGTSHDVAYSPYPMVLLEELAHACEKVRKKAEADVAALRKQTPSVIAASSLSASSAARTFINRLSDESDTDELDLLANITQDDEARAQTLTADLAAKPTVTIATLDSRRARLESFVLKLQRFELAVGEAVFNDVHKLRERVRETASLAQLASDRLFANAPLPDVGGAQWQALWEAARRYSDQVAYPHQHFVDAKAGEDLCVLCMQPLSTEALARRMTLEEFVTSTTKLDERHATQALKTALATASQSAITLQTLREGLALVGNEIDNEPLGERLRASALSNTARLRALIAGTDAPTINYAYPTEIVAAVLAALVSRIEALSADENSDNRRAMSTELNGLQDRMKLRDMKADLRAEIDRRKEAARLQVAIGSTTTNSITAKNKELSNQLVTDALRNRFAREILKLEVGNVPIELRKEADRTGQSFFKVALVGKPNEPVGNILSEGEHRCVALAAFLAELVTSREYSGIVFDDPMSSLDHLYRRRVAKRLVEEAAHRQVVIFTHDLAFLFEINREALSQRRPVHYQTVRRGNGHPGVIEEGLPMKAKEAMPRANAIRSHLKGIKGSFDQMKEIERSTVAKGVIAQLRETWEQGIADFLQPVMERFDNKVKPSSMHKLLVLTQSDVTAITSARGRLSEDIHANPETLNPEEVRHDDLMRELGILMDWLNDLFARQKAAA